MDWLTYLAFFLAALALAGEFIVGAGGLLLLLSVLAGLSGASLVWWGSPMLHAWSTATILVLSVSAVAILGLIIYLAKHLYRKRSDTGMDALLHAKGRVLSTEDPFNSYAEIQGERWKIESDAHLEVGQIVQVISKQGLVLTVRPVTQQA
ncbi:NfeD family protein [Alcaligenes endophyticus]|uniref:NfeD-like C-terminal domain-containing protein n=1 Tax=Alcaligenes endophyticus TaxID=1929088 RepID=A0ABT8EJJ1_9BURK|nr:NfeD family protein [Alcaligenes endophyticus]MCX5591792.1 hypothetical protein [Alcaligenes endophyticus]MDN4121469.1 hypothetical protein [Alcaligenes endophyticus]